MENTYDPQHLPHVNNAYTPGSQGTTWTGRARTTAASSPTQRTTRCERLASSSSNAAISARSPPTTLYRWR